LTGSRGRLRSSWSGRRRRCTILFPKKLLPGVEEGDVLEITVRKEMGDTEDARERVSSLIEKLRQKED